MKYNHFNIIVLFILSMHCGYGISAATEEKSVSGQQQIKTHLEDFGKKINEGFDKFKDYAKTLKTKADSSDIQRLKNLTVDFEVIKEQLILAKDKVVEMGTTTNEKIQELKENVINSEMYEKVSGFTIFSKGLFSEIVEKQKEQIKCVRHKAFNFLRYIKLKLLTLKESIESIKCKDVRDALIRKYHDLLVYYKQLLAEFKTTFAEESAELKKITKLKAEIVRNKLIKISEGFKEEILKLYERMARKRTE